jgi:hypothetical protein
MSIIAQTLLTNKAEKHRHVTWAGVSLNPGETRIIEGLYPGSCKTPSAVRDMTADVEGGIIGVVLITNLPTTKPSDVKRKVEKDPPKKLKGTDPVKLEAGDSRKAMSEVGKKADEAVFQKGSIDEAQPKETRLKKPEGDGLDEQLQPTKTRFLGGDDPRGTIAGDDPLQQLGKILVPEMTRGAAELVNAAELSNFQMAKLTQNGSVKKITKPMVKNFFKQEGIEHGEGSDNDGNAESAFAGEGADTDSFD